MVKFINPAGGGTARTIKANYWKVSLSNFVHKDGLGATAVMRVYENNNRRFCVPLTPERTGAESGGVSPTIGVGQHSGVEPRIRVVYEKGQSGSDCEPDPDEAEESAETEGVLHRGACSERGHDDGGNLEPLIPVIYESDKLCEQRQEQRKLEGGRTQTEAGTELR